MVIQSPICRIGVFYDGSYFSYARRYFYRDRNLGWLTFPLFQAFLERFVSTKEHGFTSHKVVCASWHQGLFKDATEGKLRFDRDLYHDLVHAGVEPKYLPTSQAQGETSKEKGVDVALAVDALQVGLDGKIDVAVLVSGDGDFVPLVRVLNKHGIRVLAAYFDFTDSTGRKSFINLRLLKCCNYDVDICALEGTKDSYAAFVALFEPRMNGDQAARTKTSLPPRSRRAVAQGAPLQEVLPGFLPTSHAPSRPAYVRTKR